MRSDASLYAPMRADQLPDFVLPLAVVEQGHRVVFAPQALLKEEALASEAAEYRMRIRVALRALWALWDKRALLNPLRFPLFSWQLVSHKLLRYLSVLPLSLAAVLNWLLLSRGWVYVVTCGRTGLHDCCWVCSRGAVRYAGWLWLAIATTSCS